MSVSTVDACTSAVDAFATRRLSAERVREGHFELLVGLFQDPRVAATLGGPITVIEAKNRLEENDRHWNVNGFGFWVFHDKRSGDFVGRGGLRRVRVEGTFETEIAYAVASDYWDRGLATEMADAIVDIAFRKLNLADLVAFTLPTNVASRRVMEKVGFSYERDIQHAGLPHVLYRRTSEPRRHTTTRRRASAGEP